MLNERRFFVIKVSQYKGLHVKYLLRFAASNLNINIYQTKNITSSLEDNCSVIC